MRESLNLWPKNDSRYAGAKIGSLHLIEQAFVSLSLPTLQTTALDAVPEADNMEIAPHFGQTLSAAGKPVSHSGVVSRAAYELNTSRPSHAPKVVGESKAWIVDDFGCKMNAVEIEEAVTALAERRFDRAEFPYLFLQAFGNTETTLKRLRAGASNKSDVGGVIQTNNVHIAMSHAR